MSRNVNYQPQNSPLPTPDPKCLCVSDLQTVSQNSFHPTEATFALELLRSALQQRSTENVNLIKKVFRKYDEQ